MGMQDTLEGMLERTEWVRRAKRAGFEKVVVTDAGDPYGDEGGISLQFTDVGGARPHPQYSWVTKSVTNIEVNLSIMPEGCGMVVVSNLWGFTGDAKKKKAAAYLMDLLTAYAKQQSDRRTYEPDEELWGNTLLATTNTEQRAANTYFRRAGWKQHIVINNPRSGDRMRLWGKHLNKK